MLKGATPTFAVPAARSALEPQLGATPSLRELLSWLVVAGLLPLVLLVCGLVYADYRANQEQARRHAQDVARSLALMVERELHGMAASMEVLALSPMLAKGLTTGDLDAFRQRAEAVVRVHYPGASVALFEPDGRQLLNTSKPPGAPLPRRLNTEALSRVVATGSPAVSDLFEAAPQSRPSVTVDVPVRGPKGEISAVLSLAPPLETFAQVVRQQRAPRGWVISVFDRQGVNVARTPNAERFTGKPASPKLRSALLAHEEGTTENVTLEGTPVLTAWSRPGPSDWSVAIGVPAAEIYAPLRRALGVAVSLSVLALLGALILARVVARRIARPVRALVDLAANPRSAQPEAPSLGLREADAVARALTAAARARDTATAALLASEAELRRINEGLEARVREEIAAREEVQARLAQARRMEALGQLAGGIAHDVNNVLQTVQSGAELIESGPDRDATRRFARMILDAAARGGAVTQRLLAFSRQADLRAEPVNAAALLMNLRELLAHTLGGGIEVRVAAEPELPPLLVDKGQIETVLVNLATNARDAMLGGGTITLAAAAEILAEDDSPGRPRELKAGTYLRLSVSDTGTGMDAATLARTSDPFFTTKPFGKGTGLGLAMAQGFAGQSGGSLLIESTPEHGTVVTLWLLAAQGTAAPAVVAWLDAEDAPPRCGMPRARILLADDAPLIREITAEQLEGAGYAVLPIATPFETLELLDAGEAVDIIVSDFFMPGMDGVSLIREVRRRRPGLPAILLTGFVTDGAELAAYGATSEAFSLLHKPVEGRVLVECVAATLAEVPARAQT